MDRDLIRKEAVAAELREDQEQVQVGMVVTVALSPEHGLNVG